MTKEAFELRTGDYAMSPSEYTHYILSQRAMIEDLADALDASNRAHKAYVKFYTMRGSPPDEGEAKLLRQVAEVLKQARKELER